MARLFIRPFIVLSLLFLLSPSSVFSSFRIVWSYRPPSGYVDATPAPVDLDGDGSLDLVMATTSGKVVALDAQGHIKWQHDLHHIVSQPVAVAGTPAQVYVLTNPGGVVCLDGRSGILLWEYHMPESFLWGSTAPAAADLDGDGRPEVVVADRGGHLVALHRDGSLLWSVSCREGFRSAPALADLDGDGHPEVMAGTTDHPLVCFSHKGRRLWHSNGPAYGASPYVVDLDLDGRPEILVGDKEGLALYDDGGSLRWHHPMPEAVHDAYVAGDLDDDGRQEVVVVDMRGHVACLDSQGRTLWTARVGARARRAPALADVNGDGRTEVIIGSYDDHLSLFDPLGTLVEEIPLHGGMNSTPLTVPLPGHGHPVVVCTTTSGVTVFDLMSRTGSSGTILSGQYRHDPARTGNACPRPGDQGPPVRISVDAGDMHTGVNHFTMTVQNPSRKALSLDIFLRKDKESPVQRHLLSHDTLIRLSVAYALPGDHPLTLHTRTEVRDDKRILHWQERDYYIIPFAKDLADLQKYLRSIHAHLTRLKEAELPALWLAQYKKHYEDLSARARLAGVMTPLERASLRSDLEELTRKAIRLDAVTAAAAEAGKPLALYAANPWAPFGAEDELVEGRTPPPQLVVEAFGGEKESAALNIANYSDRSLTVRFEPGTLIRDDSSAQRSFRQVLTLHEVVAVPTHSLDLSYDALPRMAQSRTLVLPPWSLRQVWITVDVSALDTGWWSTPIRCRSLEVEPAEATARLKVHVWPVTLTPDDPLRLCQWGYVETSVLKEIPEAALRDQVEHGTNVFVASARWAPHATYNAEGILTEGPDFSDLDRYIHEHAPYGIILFGGYQSALQGAAPRYSQAWYRAYKEWIRRWRDHMNELGVPPRDYAFYPIDEPGLREGLVEEVVKLARPLKEVDPTLRVYADPVARASLDDLKKMAPYIDIWCPNRTGYLLHEGHDKLEYILSLGKTVWTYECLGDAKHQSPLGYYRAQAWLSWWRGLTGIGFWSYCTSRHDPWYVPRGGQDYLLIYQGDGVVTSKRWEAVRDGKEDYNILVQLQRSVEHPPRGVTPEVVGSARRLLQEKIPVIAAYCGLEKDGTLPVAEGMAATRRIADRRWHTLQQTRREMATLLEKMKKF